MLTVTYRAAGVNHHVAVPPKATVSVEKVNAGSTEGEVNKLQIRIEDPFTYEAWSYYSEEAVYIMNSNGKTVGTYRV